MGAKCLKKYLTSLKYFFALQIFLFHFYLIGIFLLCSHMCLITKFSLTKEEVADKKMAKRQARMRKGKGKAENPVQELGMMDDLDSNMLLQIFA